MNANANAAERTEALKILLYIKPKISMAQYTNDTQTLKCMGNREKGKCQTIRHNLNQTKVDTTTELIPLLALYPEEAPPIVTLFVCHKLPSASLSMINFMLWLYDRQVVQKLLNDRQLALRPCATFIF